MWRQGRRAQTARELAELRGAVAELRERLTAERETTAELRYRFHALERNQHEWTVQARALTTEPPPERRAAPRPPDPTMSIDRVVEVAQTTAGSTERNRCEIEELRVAVRQLATRLEEVTFEVQGQLRDLGFEIERAAASSRTCAAVSDLALDRQLEVLRSAQVKLAAEQARYEISLRSELADLADHLRRTG